MNGRSLHMTARLPALQGALVWQMTASCWSLILCALPAVPKNNMSLETS